MPKANPLNHQKVIKIDPATIPNAIHFVFVLKRLEENMKWSRRWPNINTAKYSVGSWTDEISHVSREQCLSTHIMMNICNAAHDEERNCSGRTR